MTFKTLYVCCFFLQLLTNFTPHQRRFRNLVKTVITPSSCLWWSSFWKVMSHTKISKQFGQTILIHFENYPLGMSLSLQWRKIEQKKLCMRACAELSVILWWTVEIISRMTPRMITCLFQKETFLLILIFSGYLRKLGYAFLCLLTTWRVARIFSPSCRIMRQRKSWPIISKRIRIKLRFSTVNGFG